MRPSEPEYLSTFAALARVIGNTPMLAIDFFFRGHPRTVYAKCEHLNLTGSIKDRMALHILRTAYTTGRLRPGDNIVEATSGNTGISFAAIGTALGHPVTVFMPDWMSAERRQLITSYGAHVISVSREDGGFLGAIRKTEEMASRESDVFLPRQFSNWANIEAHEVSTGREIWLQLKNSDLMPDAFVAGVGTGGTVMGVGRFLKAARNDIRVHPVEPAESPTLSTGCKIGHHRIQGISDEFIPPILDLRQLDSVISISDGDSILMAKMLAKEIGLGVGISSGCNFLAAAQIQNDLGGDAIVVTVFPDDNKKYLTTDLLREEPVRNGFLSPEIKLTAIRVLPRVCQMCDALPTVLRSCVS
jgi:cysteine synthase A